VSKERWRVVEDYDRLSSALMRLKGQVEEKAREELEGIAEEISGSRTSTTGGGRNPAPS